MGGRGDSGEAPRVIVRRGRSEREGGEVMEKMEPCGCEAHPVWAALDALGVEYERIGQ